MFIPIAQDRRTVATMAKKMQASEPVPAQQTEDQPEPRTIPLGLGGLSAAIASMGNLKVTVDGVPDAARLSAGHFLGDGSWSVRPADLDGLVLQSSPGRNRNCRLSIRLRKIDKDMGDAVSLGAIYIDVDGDAGRAAIAGTDGAISLKRKEPDAAEVPPPDDRPSAFPEPIAKPAPAPVSPSRPAKRVIHVTRTPPAPQAVTDDPGTAAENEPSPPPPARGPAGPETPALADESPWPSTADDDPTDLGVAPPPVLHENPAPRQASNPMIVPVRVSAGLRVGKFGKTGRPEEVVSVRGRAAPRGRARSERLSSLVFVRGGPDQEESGAPAS